METLQSISGRNHPRMPFDIWYQAYWPNLNHLNFEAEFDGTMFDAIGTELEHVRRQALDPDRRDFIWTLLEFNGEFLIVPGFHDVIHLGYFHTSKPFRDERGYFEVFVCRTGNDDPANTK